jgi:hypothetical protein
MDEEKKYDGRSDKKPYRGSSTAVSYIPREVQRGWATLGDGAPQ